MLGLSLPSLSFRTIFARRLRMLCMPSDREYFWSMGDWAGVALADDVAFSPAFGALARELSLIGGRILDSRRGSV